MPSPHPSPPVLSVLALEGSQIELRTLEGLCVLFLSIMWSEYWLIPTICFGLTYLYVFGSLTIIKPYMLSFLPFSLFDNDASRWCTCQVVHPRKALLALSQAMHLQKEIFDLCPISTKYWLVEIACLMGNTMLYSKTYVSIPWKHQMPSPHQSPFVWSVIALEGSQIELRTIEGLCVLCLSFMWILTYSKYVFWVDILYSYVFSTHNNPHMPSSPRFGLLDNDASRGFTFEVTHPQKALLAISPNYHKLLADTECSLWGKPCNIF